MDIGTLTFLVVKELYENINLLAFAINDVIVVLCFGGIFIHFLVSPYYHVLASVLDDNLNHFLHGG